MAKPTYDAYERALRDPQFLARRQQFYPLVEAAAAKYGVPVELADMVFANESGYQQIKGTVPSTSGKAPQEFGFGQLMPETARRMGLRVDSQVDERKDPAKQADAAVKYLAINYRLAGGDWGKVARGYNAGEGRINTPYEKLQPVTQNYVDYLSEGQRRLAGGGVPKPAAQPKPAVVPQQQPAPDFFSGGTGYFNSAETPAPPRVEAPSMPQYMPDEGASQKQVMLGGPIQAYLRQLGFN